MKVQIKRVSNSEEREQGYSIRNTVFCIEQNVPYNIEMDEFDATAVHIIATINNKPVGTARFRFTSDGAKMERFAVLQKYRNKGVGKALVEYILGQLSESKCIYLNAQESVIEFYKKFGFEVEGKRFYEANIPHRKMVLTA